MPDNSAFGPPILNPTDENMQSWQDMQRKQMLAQMLMQNMQTSGQTPDNWDSMRVVPHRGLLQNLAPIASALLAGKAMKGSQAAQQSYLQKKYSDQPPMQPQASNGQPGGTAQQSPGLLPQQPQNPMLAPGVSRARSQQLMDLMGGSEYGKGVVLPQLMGSPEWQNALRATGGNVEQARAFMLQKEQKAAFTPPVEVRKENLAIDPFTHKPIAYNPSVPEGTFPSFDASGMPSKVNEIPNALKAREDFNKASTAGTQSQTPIKLGTDENGKDIYGYPIPPAASGNSGSRYFNNATGPGSTASPANIQSQKSGAEAGQNYAAELSKNATGATEVRRSISELKNLSQQATPGAANEAKAKLGAFMIAAGADPANVARWTGVNTGALQAAQKQTATLAVNSIHSMTSRGTNFDLDTFMRNNPNMNMADPAAFARVADYMNNKASQDIAKQKDFANWKKTSGVTPDDWETQHTSHWLDTQNQAIDKGQSNSARPSVPIASLAELQAEARKRGLLK